MFKKKAGKPTNKQDKDRPWRQTVQLGPFAASSFRLTSPSDAGEQGRKPSCCHLSVRTEGNYQGHDTQPPFISSYPGAPNTGRELCSFSLKIWFSPGVLTPPALPFILLLRTLTSNVPSVSAKSSLATTFPCPTLSIPPPLSSPNLISLIHLL